LNIFEKEVYRKILGPVYENKNKKKLEDIIIQGVPQVKVTTSGECSLC